MRQWEYWWESGQVPTLFVVLKPLEETVLVRCVCYFQPCICCSSTHRRSQKGWRLLLLLLVALLNLMPCVSCCYTAAHITGVSDKECLAIGHVFILAITHKRKYIQHWKGTSWGNLFSSHQAKHWSAFKEETVLDSLLFQDPERKYTEV